MVMITSSLDRALRSAGIPIHGVSMGDPADKQTWVVNFKSEATQAQQAESAALLAAFDPNDPAAVAVEQEIEAIALLDASPALVALVDWLAEALAVPASRIRRDVIKRLRQRRTTP